MLEFLIDNSFHCLRRKGFPTDNRHSYGHKLCPSPSRHISVLIRSGIHRSLLSAGRKREASQFNFKYRYIDKVLSINNQHFTNYLDLMYSCDLEINNTTESKSSAKCQSVG